MRKSLVLAALAALCVPAAAADLPVKALPTPILAGYTGYGFYKGMNMGGGGGRADVSIPTVGSQNQVDLQALIGLTVGYAYTISPTRWVAVEADVDMMNLSTASGAGLPVTVNGIMDVEARLLYGFPVRDFLAMLPISFNLGTATLPPFGVLPSGVVATNSHMYVFGGVDFKNVSVNLGDVSKKVWLVAPEIGIGNRVQLSNGMAMDTSLAVQFDSKGECIGAPLIGTACGNTGTQMVAKLKILN